MTRRPARSAERFRNERPPLPAVWDEMRAEIDACGQFKEVIFYDFDDAERKVRSGLLDEQGIEQMVSLLREISNRLRQPVIEDENQSVLPFFDRDRDHREAVGF